MVILWIAVGVSWLACAALGLSLACIAKANESSPPPLPDRTEGMCEYGPCRDKATVRLDLGPRGVSFICDHHVGLIVRENIEPEFEAMGVVA